jgi:hypothetical protein
MNATPRSFALLLALALPLPAAAAEPAAKPEALVSTDAVPTGVSALEITVAPWGDIIVDGHTREKNVTRSRLYLPVGVHDVEIKNPWSRRERRRIEVTEGGATLRVRLRPLPASLIVHSNVDADVLIDGISVGRSWTSEIAPLAVPLDGWRARRRVRITLQRPGYKPLITEATLMAGTRTVIGARLVETQDDLRRGGIAYSKPLGSILPTR